MVLASCPISRGLEVGQTVAFVLPLHWLGWFAALLLVGYGLSQVTRWLKPVPVVKPCP